MEKGAKRNQDTLGVWEVFQNRVAQEKIEGSLLEQIGCLFEGSVEEAWRDDRRGVHVPERVLGQVKHGGHRVEKGDRMAVSSEAQGNLSVATADVENPKRFRVGSPCLCHEGRQLMPDDFQAETPMGAVKVLLIRGGTFCKGYGNWSRHG
jgi:hypothetical protein